MPTFVQFPLPDVGEGLTEADIVEWKVAVGDTVTVNQPLLEIETAKSLVELPSPHAGLITELLVEVGASVDVGTPIITFDVDPHGGDDSARVQDAGDQDEASGDVLVGYGTSKPAATRRPRRTAGAAGGTQLQPPPASPGASGGQSPPAADAAPIAQAAPAAQATSEAQVVPARTAASGARVAPASPTPGDAGADPLAPPRAVPTAAPEPPARNGLPILAKPPVRKLAKDLGVELSRVRGTGPGDIVTRGDVLDAAETSRAEKLVVHPEDDRPWLGGGTVSRDGRQTRVPVRSVRRRTAEAMVTSAFTAPHVTVFTQVDVTKTMRLVDRLKADKEFADVRVTPLLIAAKALIIAIRRHPEISASWDEQTQEIVYKHYINLGIAAATNRGLVVPNIKDAHRMSLHELAVSLGDLTASARASRTSVASMQDGTVTITNVGVFGIDTGTPILNPGESAILAFGAVGQRPWMHKGKIKPRWITQLALSFDHRLVDGELGSRVLADIAAVMAEPARGLVWG